MKDKKLNILFFLTDDQRFDAVGALGGAGIKTPNMDRLAETGTSFINAHIPGGTVGAVCMPSRAMLLTGRSLFHIRDSGAFIPEEHPTIGEVLRGHGYQSFASGKWHNGTDSFSRGFSCGDDIFFGGMADHWNVPVHGYDPSGKYERLSPQIPDFKRSNRMLKHKCDHIHAGRHSSELVADAGIRFLDNYRGEAPFFALLSFLAPHDPRTMPGEFLEMYNPDDVELPPSFMREHPFDNGALGIRDELLAARPRNPGEIKRHIAEYRAMTSHLDFHIGRVLEKLAGKGLTENTLILLAGDNGLALGQHGLMGKQNCYEHSVRVPLVFSGPGVPAGARSAANVYLFDIFPTLCEFAGAALPGTSEGISLADYMDAPGAEARERMYFAYSDLQRAAKQDGYKLIEYAPAGGAGHTQLFNLKDDPWELCNLAVSEPAKLSEMRKVLAHLRDEWDDCGTPWGRSFWEKRAKRTED